MKNETVSLANASLPCSARAGLSEHTFTNLALHRFPAVCLQKLQALKERIASSLAAEFAGAVHAAAIQQAVNEADSLAATTPFPALFLPALAEEKVRAASVWQNRQTQIRQRALAFAA